MLLAGFYLSVALLLAIYPIILIFSPMKKLFFLLIVIVIIANACSTKGPVLYPNEQAKEVSDEQIDHDIKECVALAESSGARSNSVEQETKETATDVTEGAITGAATGAV